MPALRLAAGLGLSDVARQAQTTSNHKVKSMLQSHSLRHHAESRPSSIAGLSRAGALTALALASLPSNAMAQLPAPGDSPAITDSAYGLERQVIKARAKILTRKESDQVARMPLRNLENPQAYAVVPKELVRDQIAVDYNSAFKNIPGTTRSAQWMQGGSQFYSRGFETSTEVRNGLSTNVVSDFDPVNLERIEAIRGPAGALFGAGSGVSYGGLFNRVTKVPLEDFKGEASWSAGSWNLNRLTADVNAPLDKEKTLLLRVNLARHQEGSFMDHGFSDAWAVAPSLLYKVNDRLTLSLDAESYSRTGTAVPQLSIYGGSARSIGNLGIDYRRSFLNNSLASVSRTANVYAKAGYAITDKWSSETIVSYTGTGSDLASIYLGVIDDSLAMRWHDSQNWKVYTRQFQHNFRGEISAGPIRNQLLIGFGAGDRNSSWPYAIAMDTINFRNPGENYLVGMDQYRARIAAQPLSMWLEEYYSYNAYVSDAVHLGDRFTALLGLRWDRFDNRGSSDGMSAPTDIYDQDAIAPKAGLVFQPVKDVVSLYANYQSGYRNVTGRSYAKKSFVPERAHQVEAGAKVMAPGGLLAATTSVYGIEVGNLKRADLAHPGFSVQDGTQESRGVEVDVAAHPLRGLSLVAGYGYNHSEMTNADEEVEGRRPATAGPEESANFWASYELPDGPAKGIGAGLGGNYASEAFNVNTSSSEFTVPAYTLWDATVFYDSRAYRIGLKVDNITNEKYWSPAYLQPGPLRRFMGNITYKF
jgi:iron complex outermembrane receptor protein